MTIVSINHMIAQFIDFISSVTTKNHCRFIAEVKLEDIGDHMRTYVEESDIGFTKRRYLIGMFLW